MTGEAGRPLAGVRFVEFDGLGPTPFAAMMLADLGAEGIRVTGVTREGIGLGTGPQVYHRGRTTQEIDLKAQGGSREALALVAEADVLIEGFRPGVMERLGLGPEECLKVNPRLVYGRVSGYGQVGPRARDGGHDINYLALSGALNLFRREGQMPVPPLNLLADFGGGGLMLVVGVLSALINSRESGRGRVVDAAMVDGVAAMLGSVCGRIADGSWSPVPGTNLLDTGAPFYDTYETSDGRFMAVGAIEQKFYNSLLTGLALRAEDLPSRWERANWPALRTIFAKRFGERSFAEWASIFGGLDACVTPVLTLEEAQLDPGLVARGTYTARDGVMQPAAAPRFSWR